ncbi:MAG: FtsX-like permease family protein [bacterium]
MNLRRTLSFAWRYFSAKKSTNAINIISWVSVTAIMFGTASLIVILSAFNGFESLVKSLYASFYPDIKISPVKGKVIRLTQEQINKIRGVSGVGVISFTAETKALIQHDILQTVVQLKGVDSNYIHVAGVPSSLYRGRFTTGTMERPEMVMGVGVEQSLGLLSDRTVYPVSVYLPKNTRQEYTDPMQALGVAMAYPSGSFAIQSEFDNKYVITNLAFLRSFLGYAQDEFGSVEIKLSNIANDDDAIAEIREALGSGYLVQSRYEQNSMLYNTIKMEKLAIYGIFSLILIVAAFTMIGALSMLVIEKKKDIQVMKAMGASDMIIQKIFMAEGVLLACIGTSGGIAIALLLYYLQTTYKLIPLEGATFLIDYYPVKLILSDFILVVSTVMMIGLLASWIPSRRAARAAISLQS